MRKHLLLAWALIAVIGLAGCENPADNVPPATVTDAQPVPDEEQEPAPEPATQTESAPTPEPAAEEPVPAEEPMTEEPMPAEEPEPAPEPEPEPAEEPMELSFTDNSMITFEGSKVTGSHAGGFVDFTGTVNMPDGTFETAQINIVIQMDSLFSDDKVLTETLKGERFFEVEKYPTSKFVSTAIEKTDDGYMISGNLEMHGVTKGITFPATVTFEDGVLTSDSEFSIDRFQWGIEDVGMQDDLIRKQVVIRFEIEAA
jgi:polyisoprenoid-binding protein YceI